METSTPLLNLRPDPVADIINNNLPGSKDRSVSDVVLVVVVAAVRPNQAAQQEACGQAQQTDDGTLKECQEVEAAAVGASPE